MIAFLRNIETQTAFEKNGYVVVNAFDSEIIAKIQAVYDSLQQSAPSPFHSTLHNPDPKVRKEIYDCITAIIHSKVQEIFIEPHIITASFVVKEPHAQSHVIIHQDWNLTHEDKYPGINMWFPLVDTQIENGSLYVLPGSHRLRKTIRGTGTPDPLAEVKNLSLDNLTRIDLKVGQVIIYDVRMLHGSPPNTSSTSRVACAIGLVPSNAELIHYTFNPEKKTCNQYKIDDSFFLRYQNQNSFFDEWTILKEEMLPCQLNQREIEVLITHPAKHSILKRIFTSIMGK